MKIKKLLTTIHKHSGHNNQGKITVYHRGGGHKRLYRKIDFKKSIRNIPAIVIRTEYDPYRTSNIALVGYKIGLLSYVLAYKNIKPGSIILNNTATPITEGNTLLIKNIPIGTIVHNIELKPGKGGQIARSAGSYAIIINKQADGYAVIKLVTGEFRLVPILCLATIGIVDSNQHSTKNKHKAGFSRWKNRRPIVRGVAMNPVDHPHGGRTKGGRPSVTPWGISTKGYKTVRKVNKFIIRRRS